MKALGIVRKIDDLGRLVIPKEVRDIMKLESGTPMEMFFDGETIIVKQYKKGCLVCGSTENTITRNNNTLCEKCLEEFLK